MPAIEWIKIYEREFWVYYEQKVVKEAAAAEDGAGVADETEALLLLSSRVTEVKTVPWR